jgi:CRISPR type III-A-associated RAMP protein Csm5
MSDVYRVTCLTPVHVGSGQELTRDIDFLSEGANTYILDPERLITAGAGVAGLPEAIARGERVADVLRAKRISLQSLAARDVAGRIEAGKLRLALRAGDGRPMVPGSSLKGALRTLLLVGWAANGRPHEARSREADAAIASGLRGRKPDSKPLDDQLFRSPVLRDPRGDALRTLRVSDAVFHPDQLEVVSSKAVGTSRQTLTAAEVLKAGATASLRLTFDRSALLRPLRFPHALPSWEELAGWSRSHARHLLEGDRQYFAGQPRGEGDRPRARCEQLLAQLAALPKEAAILRLAWGTGWRTMTGDLLTGAEQRQLGMRVGKTRKAILAGHSAGSELTDVLGWIRLDPISANQAGSIFVSPAAPTADRTESVPAQGAEPPLKRSVQIADPFLDRLRTFKPNEYSQLPQLLQQINSRPDREDCLDLLATRLLALYGTDKKQLKALREKFPALAPYLAKP